MTGSKAALVVSVMMTAFAAGVMSTHKTDDNAPVAFVSQRYLADALDVSAMAVNRAISLLEVCALIVRVEYDELPSPVKNAVDGIHAKGKENFRKISCYALPCWDNDRLALAEEICLKISNAGIAPSRVNRQLLKCI